MRVVIFSQQNEFWCARGRRHGWRHGRRLPKRRHGRPAAAGRPGVCDRPAPHPCRFPGPLESPLSLIHQASWDGSPPRKPSGCYRGGGGQGESLYGGHPHVEEFSAANFPDGPREVAVVEFYAPWW